MPEKIYIYDPFPDRDHYIKILNDHGFAISVFQDEEELFKTIDKSIPHLLISELKVDNLSNYLIEINKYIKDKYFPHMAVTSNRNIYDISLAETYNVRPIILKPVSFEHLTQTVNYKILNKNRGLIICEEKDKIFYSKCFSSQGFHVAAISRNYELHRTLYSEKWDFIIYIEGNEDFPSHNLLNKFLGMGFDRLPIYFFLKNKNVMLTNLLGKYSLCRFQNYPWDFELAEDHLMDMIIRSVIKEQDKIIVDEEEESSEYQKNQSKENSLEEEQSLEDSGIIETMLVKEAENSSKDNISRDSETDTGSYSLKEFTIKMETEIRDHNLYKSLKSYIERNSDFHRKKCIDGFAGKNRYYPIFQKAYAEGNDALREVVIDLLADFNIDKFIEDILIKSLNDRLPSIQCTALEGLMFSDNKMIYPPVRKLLFSKEEKIHRIACKILTRKNDGQFFPELLQAVIQFEDISMTKVFLKYLNEIFSRIKDVNYFRPIFESEYDYLKEELMELFVQNNDQRIIELIPDLLENSPLNIFKIALNMLVDFASVDVIPVLLKFIKSKNADYVEDTVFKILTKNIKSKNIEYFKAAMLNFTEEYQEKILNLIKDLKEKDQYEIVTYAALKGPVSLKALALEMCNTWNSNHRSAILLTPLVGYSDKLISDYAYKILREKVDKSCIEPILKFFVTSKDDFTRERLADILGKVVSEENPSSLSTLIGNDSLSKTMDIMREYGVSLGKFTSTVFGDKIKKTDSFDLIIKTLYENEIEARAEAAFILGEQRNPEAVPHLIKFISDDNWYVRKVVIESLGKIGETSVFREIIKKMSDENAAVRFAACETLHNFKIKFRENIFPIIIREDSIKVLDKLSLLLTPFRDEKTAQKYISQLSSSSVMTRISAAVVLLGLWHEPDVNIIKSWMKSDYWGIRLLAMSYFSSKQPDLILDEMKIFIMDKSEEVRKFLVSFMTVSNKDFNTLITFLENFSKDSSPVVRLEVIKSLSNIQHNKVKDIAVEMFQSEKKQEVLSVILDLLDNFKSNEIPHVLYSRYNDFSENMQKKTEKMIRKYEQNEF